MNNDVVILSSELKALWLYSHPGVKCFDNGVYYWYDSEVGTFLWHKPNNRVHNGVYPARGLNERLASALKKWAD